MDSTSFRGKQELERTLRLRFNFAETIDEGFREMWFQNERPENALCAFVDPLVFAEALIGDYFLDVVHGFQQENILLFRKRPRYTFELAFKEP